MIIPKLALALLLTFMSKLCHSTKDTFSRISDSLFTNIECVPYAYGDFNADKRVDIFCVNKSGDEIEIWLAQEKEPLFSRLQSLSVNSQIVNIVPGDFTGDSVMDLLVTYKHNNNYKMNFYQGKKTSKYNNDLETVKIIEYEINDQPFVSDFNGDGRLDLLLTVITNDQKETGFYYFDTNGTIQKLETLGIDSNIRLKKGFSHSISDLNNDFKPDLILTGETDNNKLMFYVLYNNPENNQYEERQEYEAPNDSLIYGQSLFADFDSDGFFEHLLPSCNNKECTNPKIFIRKAEKWNEIPIDFGNYKFIPPDESNQLWGNSISVKAGDYNLNGYLDLMLVLQDKKAQNLHVDKYAILMKNIPNNVYNASSTFNRTFEMDQHIMTLFSYSNVVQASFFDLYDDGYLDILLVSEEIKDGVKSYKIVALKNDYYDDVYFIKVMVIPGLCNVNRCPFRSLPYGLNSPGSLVRIETTSSEFQRVVMYATQLSQSSYMALQLPYTIFGLGSTPNFVELLSVGILVNFDGKLQSFSKEWHQIIPNSQLVISPYPRYNSNSWKMQLFITPSKNILMTGIALGSTMVCLIILIGLLQFREKKMDEKERKIESQRFHFDGL